MTKKYEIYDQIRGGIIEAATFEEMQEKIAEYKIAWLNHMEAVFVPSVLTQNDDGSWTQARSDENGNPIVVEQFQEPISLGDL